MADMNKSPSAWDEVDPTQPAAQAPQAEAGVAADAKASDEGTEEDEGEAAPRPVRKRGIKAWLGRHKILFVVILLLTALFVYNVVTYFTQAAAASASGYQFVRTTTLKKTSLDNSVTVSGTVASGSTASVTVADAAKLYKVTSVNVAVGDEVKEGAVICQLDTAEVEKNIAKAKQDYADTLQSAQTSLARAQDDYNTAITQHENTLIDLQEKIEQADKTLGEAQENQKTAQDAYNSAASYYDNVNNAFNAANSTIATFTQEVTNAQNTLNNKLAEVNSAVAAYDALLASCRAAFEADNTVDPADWGSLKMAADTMVQAYYSYNHNLASTVSSMASGTTPASANEMVTVHDVEIRVNACSATQGYSCGAMDVATSAMDTYTDAYTRLSDAQNNYAAIDLGLTGYTAIQQALTQADAAKTSADNALKQANTAVETAQQQVTAAHDSYDNEKNYSSLKTKNQTVEDAQTKLTQAQRTPDSLTTYYQTLEDCTLTATMNGTITALNATVGSVCSSTVATIQDTDGLTVEVTISADKVPSVKTGMTCYITADTTEQTLTGTLTQIDPVANDKGTFGAKVSVAGDGSALLIGTQASVEIMESQTENVFVVPLDAVGTAEDGSSFVYRQNGGEGVDMTFEQVKITTGNTNDYYVEITGDSLAEGDVIRSSADLKEGIETGDNTQDLTSMMMGGNVEVGPADGGGNGNGRPNRDGAAPGGM